MGNDMWGQGPYGKVPHDIISPMPVVLHWCVEIEVRDIGCDYVSIWGGVGTFKQTLGSCEVHGAGTDITGVVYKVAPYCHADLMSQLE